MIVLLLAFLLDYLDIGAYGAVDFDILFYYKCKRPKVVLGNP